MTPVFIPAPTGGGHDVTGEVFLKFWASVFIVLNLIWFVLILFELFKYKNSIRGILTEQGQFWMYHLAMFAVWAIAVFAGLCAVVYSFL